MFQTLINIERKLAVRNGFVEIPDGPLLRTSLTPEEVLSTIPGSKRIRIGLAPSRIVDQEWIILPAFDRFDGAPEDFFEILRNAG